MAVKFYDTNALLELQESAFEENFVISSVTLEELENIKSSGNKSDEVRFKARNVVRLLKTHENNYEVVCYDEKIEKIIKGALLEVTPDTKICACAKHYSKKHEDVIFVTNDICCKFFAEHIFELNTDTVHEDSKGLYLGYKEIEMTEEEMANFFQYPTTNYYNLMVNEYLIIKGLEKDNVYKWTGDSHELVPVRAFKSKFFKDTKPKNAYQVCAMDSICSNMITMLFGRSASGKTLLPITYAEQMLEKGKYDNITFIYSYDPLKGAKELGFEKGDHNTKLLNYGAIGNILATKYGRLYEVEDRLDKEVINIVPTANIRGMSLKDSVVIVTEAQNLDPYTLKTIIQRCENNCKLIIEGDVLEQTDTKHLVSGMQRFSDVFAGHEDIGIVKLKGNFRSKMGELADEM